MQGDSVCTACTAGSYSETSGKSTCSPCEAGKFSLTSAVSCFLTTYLILFSRTAQRVIQELITALLVRLFVTHVSRLIIRDLV